MAPSLRRCLQEDFARHGSTLASRGFRAVAMYRLGVWRRDLGRGVGRKALRIPYVLLHRRARNRYRIELHYTAAIGRRVLFSDLGNIVIGNQVQIVHKLTDCAAHRMGEDESCKRAIRSLPVLGEATFTSTALLRASE
jgi:serine acetyltransferase